MSLFVYAGPPGARYPYLHTRHGIAPFSNLQPGDVVDFGEHQPPEDDLWTTAKSTAVVNRRPDNAPDLTPVFSSPAEPPDETAVATGPARPRSAKKGVDA